MDCPRSDPGLASGIFNTSQQLGNAVALAAIATLAAAWTARNAEAEPDPAALATGYNAGFFLAAAIVVMGLLPASRLDARRSHDSKAAPASPRDHAGH